MTSVAWFVPIFLLPMFTVFAAIAQTIQAIRATGLMVQVDPATFLQVLGQAKAPLVLHSVSGLRRRHKYAVAHRGYVVWTTSPAPLTIEADMVETKRLDMPSV